MERIRAYIREHEEKRQDAASTLRPAAGTFDGWPKTAAELKILDPCCGSGHFLVAALHHLVPIRMAEEGLSAVEAVDAVLRDNLHGLEIDERCSRSPRSPWPSPPGIFPSPLTGEGRGEGAGYRPLPDLHIACTGIGPQCSAEQWLKLAKESGIPMPTIGREAIKNGLLYLHRLFTQAPTLGSLINPAELPPDLIAADYETIQPYLAAISKAEKVDDETHERAVAAAGMVKAADLLAGEYTLVITNVPYLARKAHCDVMLEWADADAPRGRSDLATLFVLRCIEFLGKDGAASLVTHLAIPDHLWSTSQEAPEDKGALCCGETSGREAFDAITGHVVNVALSVIGQAVPTATHWVGGVDAQDARGAAGKAEHLRQGSVTMIPQKELLANPDSRIVLERLGTVELLGEYAHAYQGISPADLSHFGRSFWEIDSLCPEWRRWQSTIESTVPFGGRELVLWWNEHFIEAVEEGSAYVRGEDAWGSSGVGISRWGTFLQPSTQARLLIRISQSSFQASRDCFLRFGRTARPRNTQRLSANWTGR